MESASREDYLREFYLMEEKNKEPSITEIAEKLNIAKPSVTEMVKKLDKEGLATYEKYASPCLTKKGREIARKLTMKHRIIELFLTEVLKMDRKEIHDEAHRLEHAFSDKSIKKIREFLGNPKTDPHGEPIPNS
ncbi:TPA: metal-dependent transcriptional regulator [Candidatus Woesearchaeota archaeon]|nr:hypothetical protein QT06_C0001G0154 [archaeon GW2011_AR15]MBS3104044.1 metal-dependent transcriptional regulator [Candidatus Woesearchaeota archaeon]HIH40852.1 metal-dependent transcriptional regulator [Candidatus Woesearchaeota archaeon]